MPLIQGDSKASVQANTQTEIANGKPADQAYAIANAIARKIKANQSGDTPDKPAPVAGGY